ncbi:Lrp/AsnC family transcriptional regulator [Streptomyces antibioticus]|uniref:Lrp/AsnC family transcriptional regulator n=1 Tax=Streptomyces antibioticus TaxID=1890 RepID=UPI003720AD15
MDSVDWSETDLQLIHALQIHPRAPWSLVGAVLGVSPATVARRWARLNDAGLAWVTGYRAYGPRSVADPASAMVIARCVPARVTAVAAELATHPECPAVEVVSGSGDLALIVAADDREALIDYLLGRFAAVDGLLPVRTMWVTRFFTEGSRWRLRALTREQTRVLQAEAGPRPALAGPSPGRADPAGERLVDLLAEDGRMAYAELAARAGTSEPTVRRKVRALLESGRLALRCDLAPQAAGRPVLVTLTARVPADRLEAAGRTLAQLPETRLVAGVVGDADLWAGFWLPTIADTHRLERTLLERLPELHVVDRLVGMRSVKRVGQLLDERGRLPRGEPA